MRIPILHFLQYSRFSLVSFWRYPALIIIKEMVNLKKSSYSKLTKLINLWSFIFSLVCVALFFITITSNKIVNFATKSIDMHPLNIVLILSLVTFLFGVIGFLGMNSWKTMLRSMIAVILTLGLSFLIIIIIYIGNMFKFT